MIKRFYPRRKQCRLWLSFHAWTFCGLLVTAPLVVMGDTSVQPAIGSMFGLHPDLVKLMFNIILGLVGFFLIRILRQVDRSLNTLHSNQREFARVMTQITTAHNINHGQSIEPPRLAGDEV